MYRCERCRGVVPPRQPLLRHNVYRSNGSIEREIPVCQGCKQYLDNGGTVLVLNAQEPPRQQQQQHSEPVAVPTTGATDSKDSTFTLLGAIPTVVKPSQKKPRLKKAPTTTAQAQEPEPTAYRAKRVIVGRKSSSPPSTK